MRDAITSRAEAIAAHAGKNPKFRDTLKRIEQASKDGLFSVQGFDLSDEDLDCLQAMGYDVTPGDSGTTICWI